MSIIGDDFFYLSTAREQFWASSHLFYFSTLIHAASFVSNNILHPKFLEVASYFVKPEKRKFDSNYTDIFGNTEEKAKTELTVILI